MQDARLLSSSFLYDIAPIGSESQKDTHMKLIIVSNRLPLTVTQQNGKYEIIPSAGGLTTGLHSLETSLEKHWIGWPGVHFDNPIEKLKVDLHLTSRKFHPIHLTPEQIENYYEGYSNSIIWPLSHYFSDASKAHLKNTETARRDVQR